MNLLVTGGAGFVGSNLILHLFGYPGVAHPVPAGLRSRGRFHTLKPWKP